MSKHNLRNRWMNALGGLPEKTPLDARVVERVEEPGFVREKILFWSEPTEPVTAYLLIPNERSGKLPAVVCLHQHNGEFHMGKSEPVGLTGSPDMAYARELAEIGYAVIVPDLKGFEERRDGVLAGSAYEHYLAGKAFVEGKTLQRRHVWDMIRTVDYLLERPEVDGERIACIGHSLGGQEAYFLLASDERIRAGIISCGIATFQSFLDYKIIHNWAWYIPGYVELGDTSGLLELVAPRPLYVFSGLQDPIFPVPGVQAVADRAPDLYGKQLEAFQLEFFAGGHGFPKENREKAYAWLKSWI